MRRREFMALFLGAIAGSMTAWARAGAQQFAQVPPPPVPQVTPQLNVPGSQAAPPQPGNPVQQLAPLGGTGRPVSTGRIRAPGTVRTRRRMHRRHSE
jgi:hypothetical protein